MQKYTFMCWIHTDEMNSRRRKTSLIIFTSYFIARVRKGRVGFYCERELEIEHNCNILTPKLMDVNVVSFSFSRAAQTEAQSPLCWVMAFFIASYQHLLWIPTHQGPKPLRPGVAFPTTSCLTPSPTVCNSHWDSTQLPQLPSWLHYIIVQRLHDRPLDLWNRMFNRHQAEITVMQFRGHSLPVHHSVVAQWDLHLVPCYQP